MSTSGLLLHKAIVQTADPATGICTVRIPALMGGQVVTVGNEGLVKTGGSWSVPSPGTMVNVSSTEDMRQFSWVVGPLATDIIVDFGDILTNPDPFPQYATDAVLAGQVATLQAQIDALQAGLQPQVPAGTVSATVGNTPDTGYIFIDGSTVVNAQLIYPATWARIPASWKVGANMVMPNWRNRVLANSDLGQTTLAGQSIGSMSRTITTSNLPAHTHTMTHSHTASSGTTSISHSHSFSGTTSAAGSHAHQPSAGATVFVTNGPGTGAGIAVGGAAYVLNNLTDTAPDHSHTYSGTTGAADPAHSHTVTVDTFGGSTGNGGFAGAALDTTPAAGVVNFQLKVH